MSEKAFHGARILRRLSEKSPNQTLNEPGPARLIPLSAKWHTPRSATFPFSLPFFFPLREQLMFPLQFMGMLGRFDLECTVSGGGRSSQAGALRLAISRGLLSFLSDGEMENVRQGGCSPQEEFCVFDFL